jgi:hypothetical protein
LFTAALCWRGNDLDLYGFYSHDGGESWQVGRQIIAPAGQRYSDLTIAFGLRGKVHLAYMKSDPSVVKPLGTHGAGSVELLVSSDAGINWKEVAALTNNVDRPWLAVDTTFSAHRGQVYLAGNIDEPILFRFDTEGLTQTDPVTPLMGQKLINCRHANPVVTGDGTVVLVCRDHFRGPGKSQYRPRLLTWHSTDGGKTFDEGEPVNTRWTHAVVKSSSGTITMWPRLAANPQAAMFANRVYCVWADGHLDEERIFIASSDDAGATWRQPTVISEQPMDNTNGFMTFHPSVAVNREGAIAVSWYDRRGLPRAVRVPTGRKDTFNWNTPGWNVRCRASVDGGSTWMPSVQLNERPGQGEPVVGHSAGLAADADGRFHAVWIDNRTGKNQLWTTAITVVRTK